MATNQIFPASPPSAAGVGIYLCASPGAFSSTFSTNIAQSLDLNTQVLLVPFFVGANFATEFIRTYVVAGLALSTATMGIYNSTPLYGADILPTGVALGVGQTATTAQGTASVAITPNLNQNTIYWAALQASSNVTLSFQVVLQNLNTGNYVNNVTVATGLTPGVVAYTNTYSAGTLPTITPASCITVANMYSPVMWLN